MARALTSQSLAKRRTSGPLGAVYIPCDNLITRTFGKTSEPYKPTVKCDIFFGPLTKLWGPVSSPMHIARVLKSISVKQRCDVMAVVSIWNR